MNTSDNPIVVSAQDVAKHFVTQEQRITLFAGLSMEIKRGESVAIIGPSGSGKSTLLSLLAGLDQPDNGSVSLLGNKLSDMDEASRARLRSERISFVFQSFHLLPELTALENVRLPLDIRNQNNAEETARLWLQQVGLAERTDHLPSQLSGGEQQRVAIARAFATEPALLFADEPTGNLDADTGEQIIKQLFSLNKQHQTTLLLITHDPELASLCDRCFELQHGEFRERD